MFEIVDPYFNLRT